MSPDGMPYIGENIVFKYLVQTINSGHIVQKIVRVSCFKLKHKCQIKENLNNKYRRMSFESFLMAADLSR